MMESLAPFAHPSHWITSVVYFAPVVGFLAWLAFITVRERLGSRARPDGPAEDERAPG